tara:strand:- start:1079 stop:1849 length:771 start_codon:yes stop_codon:yes gene_type:complete
MLIFALTLVSCSNPELDLYYQKEESIREVTRVLIDTPEHKEYPTIFCNQFAALQLAKDHCDNLGYDVFKTNREPKDSNTNLTHIGKIELYCGIPHPNADIDKPSELERRKNLCELDIAGKKMVEEWKKRDADARINSCKEIGFEENTLDMSHCLLKIIELETILKLNNSKNTKIVIPNEQKGRGNQFNWAAFITGLNQLNNSLYGSTNTTSSTSTTCYSTGEYIEGMNKVCQYSCVGSAHAITVGAAQICPISVKR